MSYDSLSLQQIKPPNGNGKKSTTVRHSKPRVNRPQLLDKNKIGGNVPKCRSFQNINLQTNYKQAVKNFPKQGLTFLVEKIQKFFLMMLVIFPPK